jgi:methylglutamate dehydrogenase subunit D
VPEPLTPVAFLGHYAIEISGTRLTEVTDRALVSIATPDGGDAALADALRAAFGAEPPEVGRSTLSTDSETRFLGLARDQIFALLPARGALAAPHLAQLLGGPVAYLTDQSDAWVMLRLEGTLALAALERICMLDLDAGAFPPGRVARTLMEHLGTILLREADDRFLLMSASSSARSFLHGLETSLRNVA